jgi:hypothetical protein
MEIDIGDYLITSDEMQWTLFEKKVAKEGKRAGEEYTRPIGYYADANQLIDALIRREIRLQDASSFAEAEAAAVSVGKRFKALLSPTFVVEAV